MCPAGNYADTPTIGDIVAIVVSLCLVIICVKLLYRNVKDKWFFIGMFAVILITVLNIIAYKGF